MKAHERPTTKVCSDCKKELSLDCYYQKKRKTCIGYFSYCKNCESIRGRARYEKNKSKVLLRQAKRRVEKKEYIAEYHREYYQKNRDLILAKTKSYQAKPEVKAREKKRLAACYKRRKPQIALRKKERLLNEPGHAESLRNNSKEHYRKNKLKYYAKSAQRRAARKKATVKWADKVKMLNIYAQARYLTKLTGIKFVVDHVVPLQNKKVCGLHCEFNLRVITELENLQKFNKFG